MKHRHGSHCIRLGLLSLVICLVTGGCASTGPYGHANAVIELQVEYANAANVDGLVSQVSEDFTWYDVTGDGAAASVSGREAFRDFLEGYFSAGYNTHSTITAPVRSGDFFAFTETAEYDGADGRARQASLAVYEIRDGLIHNVWYFPATPIE